MYEQGGSGFFILSLIWCVQQILQTYRTGYPSRGPKKVETMAIDINEAIAVVGLDLKFPGDAANPESFYEMLLRGRSALSEIPSDRFSLDSFYHPDAERAGAVSLHLPSTILLHSESFINIAKRPTFATLTSFERTLRPLMLPSFLSHRRKPCAWTRNNGVCLSLSIEHLKVVSVPFQSMGNRSCRWPSLLFWF